jgi:hypothetical protein
LHAALHQRAFDIFFSQTPFLREIIGSDRHPRPALIAAHVRFQSVEKRRQLIFLRELIPFILFA